MELAPGTYWHVASEGWSEGDDLKCWDVLHAEGSVTDADWHWSDAPIGWDGDVVCVYTSLADAVAHKAELGGIIIKIEIDDSRDFDFRIVEEGFIGILDFIPAGFLSTYVER